MSVFEEELQNVHIFFGNRRRLSRQVLENLLQAKECPRTLGDLQQMLEGVVSQMETLGLKAQATVGLFDPYTEKSLFCLSRDPQTKVKEPDFRVDFSVSEAKPALDCGISLNNRGRACMEASMKQPHFLSGLTSLGCSWKREVAQEEYLLSLNNPLFCGLNLPVTLNLLKTSADFCNSSSLKEDLQEAEVAFRLDRLWKWGNLFQTSVKLSMSDRALTPYFEKASPEILNQPLNSRKFSVIADVVQDQRVFDAQFGGLCRGFLAEYTLEMSPVDSEPLVKAHTFHQRVLEIWPSWFLTSSLGLGWIFGKPHFSDRFFLGGATGALNTQVKGFLPRSVGPTSGGGQDYLGNTSFYNFQAELSKTFAQESVGFPGLRGFFFVNSAFANSHFGALGVGLSLPIAAGAVMDLSLAAAFSGAGSEFLQPGLRISI